jgi:DedD protein
VQVSSNSRSTARNKVNNDPVDELKRRSRRRLVGSIALFLAAIIIVPALVENEPSQTPSDVELVVPDRPSAEAPVEATAAPAEPNLEVSKAEQEKAVAAVPVAPPVAPEPKPEVKTAPEAAPKVEPKVETKVEPKVEPKPESKPEPKPAVEDPIAAFAKTETAAASGTYWVQVAAVSDKTRADALSKELSGKGFSSRVESTASANGTIYRVRVGPFAGQPKADDAKAKLAAAGYTAGRVVQ